MPRGKFKIVGVDKTSGADLAEIQVKIDKKVFAGTKRIFRNVEQAGSLSDKDLLDRLNYGEDLFVRKAVKAANSDEGGKRIRRVQALVFLMQHATELAEDKAEFDKYTAAADLKSIDAMMDRLWDDHLDDSED